MSDCKTCDEILLRFADSSTNHDINLGSFDEALSSQCPRHRPLIKAFKDHCGARPPSHGRESQDVGIQSSGRKNTTVTLYESISRLGLFFGLLLKNRPDVPNHAGTGRVLDSNWVDLDIVNKWKHVCLSEHGSRCQNPMKIPFTSPAWLVDVENKCIVPGEGRTPYVALSYRWGEASRKLRLDEDLLRTLRQHNSLDGSDIACRLPPMIKHAMSLTSAIGERYLWVDALCIVHGEHFSTVEQLNLMSAIYARTIVTIIAADGDSSDGLLGLKDISPPRDLRQKVISFGNETVLVRNTGIFSMGSGTEYYDRAWPYQEYKMSPRKLLFNRKEVHWECQCSVWHEELTLGTEVDKYIDPRLSVILAGFPDLCSLGHVITRYNERKLTYDEDALSGIAGLLTTFSRSFTGGFLYGCPEMFFDRCLGWQPHWNFSNLSRRTASGRLPADRVASTALPSWSWIGWSGLVTMQYGEAARINDRQSAIDETIPITEWYTSSAPSGRPWRRIRPTWLENRGDYKKRAADLSKPLPDGWTRHEGSKTGSFKDEPKLYPDGCGDHVFKHRNMPDDDCQEWYYPFPTPNITEATPFFKLEQTPYLFCKTKKARVYAERADYETHPGGSPHLLKICDENNNHVLGRLHLQNDEQMELWPMVGNESDAGTATGRTIEVVAIYETIKYSKTFNGELERYDFPLNREQQCVVLWVEWKGEVAYRLACGHVMKDAWEALDLKDIDLVLG